MCDEKEYNSIQEFLDSGEINKEMFTGFFKNGREKFEQTITIESSIPCKLIVQTIND